MNQQSDAFAGFPAVMDSLDVSSTTRKTMAVVVTAALSKDGFHKHLGQGQMVVASRVAIDK